MSPSSKGTTTPSTSETPEKKKTKSPQASVSETLSFAFSSGTQTSAIFFVGVVGGFGNGLVFPILAYLFSNSFTDIAGAATEGLDQLRELAFTFMVVGVYALVMATIQTTCFEVVAYRACEKLRLEWFHSLLRQDQAFFDVYDISGIASGVTAASNKYRRAMGRKFGEGIQFFTTGVGGVAYAMFASWQVALVVLALCPLISLSALAVVSLNQSKSTRAAAAYSTAGSVAYSTVSGIKTVLSLNAVATMIGKYREATQQALEIATGVLLKQGFANGSMLGSFICIYAILALYGTSLLYRQVVDGGCDPSGVVTNNVTCDTKASDVFGAMLGVAFAAQGISQVGTFLETFSSGRAAVFSALKAINRKRGEPQEIIYHNPDDDKDDSSMSKTSRSIVTDDADLETPDGRIKAILPKYEIDSSSDAGKKPKKVQGEICFRDVKFHYPTRPGHAILKGLSVDIPAGKTIAFVGPSGGGKSTIVKLLERFYDPVEGTVTLDGCDIKDINVRHLRSLIGYVGQEPTLFATSIANNIRYGKPGCSQKEIEEAARQANAHDFISMLPDGYETQVGDKGSQLSGGQKQRIAIARVLVANPKILLLDEATSALDSQSELVVQEALEKIISSQQRTTIIIAHRLSTIRNADIIAVVMGGVVAETGTHEELMASETYYKKLVDTQGHAALTSRTSSVLTSRDSTMSFGDNSEAGMEKKDVDWKDADPLIVFRNVTFSYPTRPSKPILDRFKMKIYKGETLALVGTSGGGKSTTISMIERFYDPDEGSVEYLGEDIKNLNVKWYRDQIGYVGQEPTLFDATIAENISYGAPGASREDIEEAARQANAYDFIMGFPQGFDTPVSGGSGTQLSGGQKQRIAIARALVKKPEILLLDEATSALDNASESVVQAALDKLMASRDRTIVVIAHRLSTIRNADRIAFISDGRVKEIGSHDELMEKPKGKYKKLVESQGRDATADLHGLDMKSKKKKKEKKSKEDADEEDDEVIDTKKESEESELSSFSLARARQMAAPDLYYILAGSLGALIAGSVFPMWGVLFAETIDLLFYAVLVCDETTLSSNGVDTCDAYWQLVKDQMQDRSFEVAGFWAIVAFGCIFGNMLTFWGFGQASERLSKRVRDSAFKSLVRQEVAFFDKRSVGKITSELQDDATRIETFTGSPIRSFLIAMASVFTGLVLSFVFMWPFALLALACVPMMAFATSLEIKTLMGEDVGDENAKDEISSPGGIIMETLLNMTTVSALTMEEERFKNFENALSKSEEHYVREGAMQGFLAGLSQFIQQWINGLQLWWGGWILFNYSDSFQFDDFLISNFALLFSLFGLASAFQDMSDRKEMEKSASRIFYLLDRKSSIDPLSLDGKFLDTKNLNKKKKRSSSKKRKTQKMLEVSEKSQVSERSDTEATDDPPLSDRKKKSSTKKSSKKS